MKITFIIPFASLAGGIRVVAIYARMLAKMGHDINVISQPDALPRTPLRKIKAWIRGRPPRLPQPQTQLLEFMGDRHRVLDRIRPVTAEDVPDSDIIIATWWHTAEWVAALPASKGEKIYLLQDYEVFDRQPAERVVATYHLPLRKIAVSSYLRNILQQTHGVGDVAVVRNAVDLDQFETPPRPKNNTLCVGFVYTQSPRKNIARAIAAVTQAKAALPDLRVLAFGSHPPDPALPLPDLVEYHVNPSQAEIAGLYAACDLWLFTSDNEGFGLPLLEAFASRTPVLATRAGASEDLVDGSNGLLLEHDTNVFAAAIRRFADMDDPTWQGFSEAAYETACTYTWDDATEALLRHLTEAV